MPEDRPLQLLSEYYNNQNTFDSESPLELLRTYGDESPLNILKEYQYGYPESSLNMEDDQYYGYLSMGDKELKEQQGVGFLKSLLHGFGSGFSLGHMRRLGVEPLDDKAMTTAETGAEIVGSLGGGLIPFMLASSIIGTVGAPVALAGGAMAGAYRAINALGKGQKLVTRLTKSLSKLQKQSKVLGDVGTKTTGLDKRINQVSQRLKNVDKVNRDNVNIVKEAQRQYTKQLSEKNTRASLKELKRLSKLPKTKEGLIMPATAGKLLPKVPGFNKMVKKVAENYGYRGAQVLNKFANNIGTFTAVGLASDKPGYNFADRLKDVHKDVLMGSLFAVSGLPSMYGKAGATNVEPMAM